MHRYFNSAALKQIVDDVFLLHRKTRNTYIEGLRALAIILVFNVHYFGPFVEEHYFLNVNSFAYKLVSTLNAGLIGVDLFFVLSGYLLYRVLKSRNYTFRSFLVNRLKRLLPANLIILILIVLATWNFEAGKFILNLFFLQNFLVSNPTYNYVNWSLSWEWLFYILIFFSIKLSKNDDFRVLFFSAAALLFLILNQIFFANFFNDYNLKFPDPGRFSCFYVGVVVAILEKNNFLIKYKKTTIQLLYAALLFIAIPLLSYLWGNYTQLITDNATYENLFFVSSGLAFGLLLHLTNNYELGIRRIFTNSFFRILGQISYSFYLIHAAIALPLSNMLYTKIISDINSFQDMAFCYLISFIITFFMGSFLYYYFERPYMISNNGNFYFTLYKKIMRAKANSSLNKSIIGADPRKFPF